MKRSIAVIVVALYGLLSIGVHVHLHYCCGKLSGLHLVSGADGCCGSESHEGCSVEHACCSYEEIDLSIQEDHYRSFFQLTIPQVEEISYPEFFAVLSDQPKAPLSTVGDFAVKRKLYLEFSSLIYYAG